MHLALSRPLALLCLLVGFTRALAISRRGAGMELVPRHGSPSPHGSPSGPQTQTWEQDVAAGRNFLKSIPKMEDEYLTRYCENLYRYQYFPYEADTTPHQTKFLKDIGMPLGTLYTAGGYVLQNRVREAYVRTPDLKIVHHNLIDQQKRFILYQPGEIQPDTRCSWSFLMANFLGTAQPCIRLGAVIIWGVEEEVVAEVYKTSGKQKKSRTTWSPSDDGFLVLLWRLPALQEVLKLVIGNPENWFSGEHGEHKIVRDLVIEFNEAERKWIATVGFSEDGIKRSEQLPMRNPLGL